MDCDCNHTGAPICPNCGRRGNLPQHTFIHLETDNGRIAELQVLPELESFKFSEDVKTDVTLLFQKATRSSTKRGKPRRAIIFCCIVDVCKEHGLVFDQNSIKAKLEITDRNINTARKEIGQIIGKVSSAVTIEDFVKTIMRFFDLRHELFDPIMMIYHRCKRVSVLFNSSKPETIANGLVYYYLMTNLQDFDQEGYFDKSNVSKDTIIAVHDDIVKVLKQ